MEHLEREMSTNNRHRFGKGCKIIRWTEEHRRTE